MSVNALDADMKPGRRCYKLTPAQKRSIQRAFASNQVLVSARTSKGCCCYRSVGIWNARRAGVTCIDRGTQLRGYQCCTLLSTSTSCVALLWLAGGTCAHARHRRCSNSPGKRLCSRVQVDADSTQLWLRDRCRSLYVSDCLRW